MADQTAAELISLPQGGGAVKGIGETFQPDLHTGTGSYRIPLEVPPGRGGLQPRLALTYNSGHGNGPFGLGWSLDVPEMRRKTAKRLPRYDDSDVFVLSGAEDLVPVPGGGPRTQRYRPRTEGLFARIVRHDDAVAGWEVRTRDGLISYYGRTPTAHPQDVESPAIPRVSDPDPIAPHRVLAWLLDETVDPLGNRMTFRYRADPGSSQRYLAEIRYADHGNKDDPRYLVTLRLRYEPRSDALTDRRGGFPVTTRLRCTSIETWIDAGVPQKVRTVSLTYADQLGAPAANGVSLLTRVEVTGHDGDATESLPPLEFGYTRWAPQARRYRPLTARSPADMPVALRREDADLVDLFGDGLPDVLQLNGVARYWRNRGDGRFDSPRRMRSTPAGAVLGAPGVALADLDGDGRTDLLVSGPGWAGYWPLASDGGFDPRGYVRWRAAPSFDLTDSQLRLVDLDGDGVPDALRTGAGLELYYNDPEGGWKLAQVRHAGDVPQFSFADSRVRLADMTGDGLTDIVLVHDGSITYWPALGYGRWDSRVQMVGAPRFGEPSGYTGGFDPARLLIGDVDGDGCADLVYLDDHATRVWINETGSGFAPSVTVPATPRAAGAADIRLADMLGTGTQGVLWTYDPGTQRESTYKFLDLTGGTKPYLLSSIDNHMGARTRIDYAPSTEYAIADARAGGPWQTTLPFPVQVVKRITVEDEFSANTLTSAFRYHHGYWDGAEREFRGFGRVDQRDALAHESGAHYSPPTETRTWFHQGPVGPEHGDWRELDLSDKFWDEDRFWGGQRSLLESTDVSALPPGLPRRTLRDAVRALSGQVLRSELYALDGDARQDRPYTVAEHRYAIAPVLDGCTADEFQARPVFVAHQIAERTTQWERGDDPMTTVRFTGGHDNYGRPHHVIDVGVPRGRDPTEPGTIGYPFLATITLTDYADRDDDDTERDGVLVPGRFFADRVARTARYQLRNNGSPTLAQLHAGALADTVRRRIRALEINHYDGEPFVGLRAGAIGDHGLLVRAEQLAVPDWLGRRLWPNGPPSYLTTAPARWPSEYPQGFQAAMRSGAGYVYHDADGVHEPGYYVAGHRARYDIHADPGGRGLPSVQRNPFGHDTTIAYDDFALLPVRVIDAVGLEQTAESDYRVLKPRTVTDPNGNRTQVGYTPLGLLAWTASLGKPGERTGDTPEQPRTRFVYGLRAYDSSPPTARQPVWVCTLRRTEHRWQLVQAEDERRREQDLPALSNVEIDAMFPADECDRMPDRLLRTIEYSDGFGRLLQTRVQGDSVILDDVGLPLDLEHAPSDAVLHEHTDPKAPPVIVKGVKAYDDKGRVVTEWEPYDDRGWAYADPRAARLEPSPATRFRYDARGAIVRVVHPDLSQERTVHGIPRDLRTPDDVRPTPWTAFLYDANDNGGLTHPDEGASWLTHWNTPTSTWVDARGRPIGRARRSESASMVTRQRLDIDGHVAEIVDPLGRIAAHTRYDLLGRVWMTELLDAGVTRTTVDAAGSVVEQRDAKGAIVLGAYDAAGRRVQSWARDRADRPLTLRERTVYGDDASASGLTWSVAAAANLLGRVYRGYDEAGVAETPAYDLDGHATRVARRFLRTDVLRARLPAGAAGGWTGTADVLDWQPPPGTSVDEHAEAMLEHEPYVTATHFDALERPTRTVHPQDAEGRRRVTERRYGRSGRLACVSVDGDAHLSAVIYNARGQRVLMRLGNGVLVRYAYDPSTLRLARLRSEVARQSAPGRWMGMGPGAVRQDRGYRYDLNGNLLCLDDRTPGCGAPPGPKDEMARMYEYDPLDRLISADGRECALPPATPWSPAPRCTQPTETRAYTETYAYDAADNLVRLRHAAAGNAYVHAAEMVPRTNRLHAMTVGADRIAYAYDACGNISRETTSRHLEWDHANRLATYRTQPEAAEPSVYAQYRYDASGRRLLKLVRRQGGHLDVTAYLGGGFERVQRLGPDGASVHDQLHVVVDGQRVAERRIGPPLPDDAIGATNAVIYTLSDHLGSVECALDAAGGVLSREEYSPFGETTFGGYARKRYRFTGKERDEESGLGFHQDRLLAPWLGRWVSPDPVPPGDGTSPYAYVMNRPLVRVDPEGRQEKPAEVSKASTGKPPPEPEIPRWKRDLDVLQNLFNPDMWRDVATGYKWYTEVDLPTRQATYDLVFPLVVEAERERLGAPGQLLLGLRGASIDDHVREMLGHRPSNVLVDIVIGYSMYVALSPKAPKSLVTDVAQRQAAIRRAIETRANLLGQNVTRTLEFAGGRTFRHVLTSEVPEMNYVTIERTGEMTLSTGANAHYGPGVYAWGEGFATTRQFIDLQVPANTVVERLAFPTGTTFYRLVPAEGSVLGVKIVAAGNLKQTLVQFGRSVSQ